MNLIIVVKILQIVTSVFIVSLILIQGKGGGLSSTLGSSFSVYRSRRGLEKIILILTIFLSSVLVLNSLVLISLS